ncbi:MAG: carboxypeptidase regulatory-like domain-containing protein [Myxococcota bacterium]
MSKPQPPRQQRQRGGAQEPVLLMDDDPVGALRLEGQVVDGDELPVSGARVVLGSNPPRIATSEEDGSFFFDKLVARRYTLQARASEGVAGPVTARLSANSEPVILRLKPGGTVEVEVSDARAKSPLSSATVELRGTDTQTAVTDSEGNAVITGVVPGFYRLVAYAPGYAKQFSRIRVTAAVKATARLSLRPGAAVSGKVVDPQGQPVAGAKVLYGGASEWAQRADPRRDAMTTDNDGRFRFDALPAGSFRFTARHEDYAPGSSELTTLDGSTETNELVITMEPAAVIIGKVVSQSGEPIPSARVRVLVQTRGVNRARPRQTYSDDSGAFRIGGLPRKGLELVALHESGSSEITPVDMVQPPHEREVTLTLSLTDAISGIVVDGQGEPIEGAQVSAMPDWRSGTRMDRSAMRLRGFAQELSDAGGRFSITGLQPGSYMMRASPPGTGGRRSAFMREAVGAETGDSDVKIVLEPDGAIAGKVLFEDGEPPALFTINVGGFGPSTPFSTADGTFTMSDLPAKTYRLTIRGPDFDTRQVANIEVTSGETVELGTVTVRQGRFLAGRVTRDGQPVAEAKVTAGTSLFGDGSSTSANRRGPPGMSSNKKTTTDNDGYFRISGITQANMFIVAEHDEKGRSAAQLVPRSSEPVRDLELALQPYSALQGKVSTTGGEAVASVGVTAQSQTAYGVRYSVSTGADGVYRFDRLAADRYKVSVVAGRGFRSGIGLQSRTVDVPSGQTVTADLSLDQGTIDLTVTLVPDDGESYGFARVQAVSGTITAATAAEFEAAAAAAGDGASKFSASIAGQPVTLSEMVPDVYTVCASPLPSEVEGFQEGMTYAEREGDRLPVFCKTMELADSPQEQSMTLNVEVPDYVPGPDDEPAEGGSEGLSEGGSESGDSAGRSSGLG